MRNDGNHTLLVGAAPPLHSKMADRNLVCRDRMFILSYKLTFGEPGALKGALFLWIDGIDVNLFCPHPLYWHTHFGISNEILHWI